MKVKGQSASWRTKLKSVKIRKGDMVRMLLGKDKGREGKVVRVDTKKQVVLVEGINIYKRHVRKMEGVEGGIVNLTKPVDISNVALVCPNCKEPTRVGHQFVGGKKVRVCKKCKKEIDHGKS